MTKTGIFCSVVAPCYNEEEGIEEFIKRTAKVLEGLKKSYEIVLVNDGSRDNTLNKIQELQKKYKNIVLVDLSRNFGKEIALTAGLDNASGEIIVPIDADLQDPPEFIPELIKKWKEGFDVVYAVRSSRKGETALKRLTSFLFYRVMRWMTRFDLPRDTGDFRLIDRKVLNALKELRETHRFMKGLFAWVGFKQVGIKYDRDPRFAGVTKWNYWKLFNFAIEGITSFTYMPLRISSYIGFFVSLFSFIYGIVLIALHFLSDSTTPGYSSIMVVMLLLGGIELMSLGVIGEYLGRNYAETKRRPLYFVRDIYR